ncbi:MAG: DinB family protein [Spirosomaceae bacterium]|nr:DinB family protein [Spirosomataceae bacterium]MDP5140651.1 DinB family protein [Spirosomataceae bacterium]
MEKTANNLRNTIIQTVPLFQQITNEAASFKISPEKWSTKEIVGHLIDSAANNHQRFVRLQYNETLIFPKYEQEEWVSNQHYNDADWQNLISLWQSFNLHLAFMMEKTPSDKLQRSVEIGGSKPFTLEFIMNDYVEHLKHHLKSIFPELSIVSKFENIYK